MSTIFLSVEGTLAPRDRTNPLVLDDASVVQLRRIVKATDARVVVVDWYSIAPNYEWSVNTQKLDLLAQLHVYVANFLPRERRTYVGSHVAIRRYLRWHKIKRWVWLEDVPSPQGVMTKDGRSRFPYPLPTTKHLRPTWDLDTPLVDRGLTTSLADKAIAILNAPCPIDTRRNDQIARLRADYDATEKSAKERHPWQGPPGECCLRCIYTNKHDRSQQVRRLGQIIKLLCERNDRHDDGLLEQMKKTLEELA